MNSFSSSLEREKQWLNLQNQVKACYQCELHKEGITFPIFGEGPLDAKVAFIGEAPGAMENKLKRPFVGPSGKILTEFLETIGLARKDVFISNIVKCRPPKNRDPRPNEITSCEPYLFHQITLLQAKIVVPLGRFAARFFLDDFKSMTEVVGKIIKMKNQNFHILPMFHPATCLYQRPKYFPLFEQDFMTLKDFLIQNKLINGQKPLDLGIKNKLTQLDDFF